jgi:hypothetical protein
MKLFLPVVGSKYRLKEDWTVALYWGDFEATLLPKGTVITFLGAERKRVSYRGRLYGVSRDETGFFSFSYEMERPGKKPIMRRRWCKFGAIEHAEFEFVSGPEPTYGEQVRDRLRKGEVFQVTVSKLMPGNAAMGKMWAVPRGGLTWEELQAKPWMLAAHGDHVLMFRLEDRGSYRSVYRGADHRAYDLDWVKQENVIGYATDSPMEILALSVCEKQNDSDNNKTAEVM